MTKIFTEASKTNKSQSTMVPIIEEEELTTNPQLSRTRTLILIFLATISQYPFENAYNFSIVFRQLFYTENVLLERFLGSL